MLVCILDHDNGRIDHGADRDRNAAKTHDVGSQPEQLHRAERHQHTNGQHQDRHQRTSDMQQEDDTNQGNDDAFLQQRMLEGGEDPVYLARRLLRFASEDVGLADNFAVVLANATFDACHKLGMPECNVHLAQLVIYLSKAKKSVSAYFAYGKAKKDVETFGNLPVPMHIRNAPTKLMQKLGYSKGYKYTPLEDSSDQEYLPKELKGRKYL